jgi:hypothetical protein
VNRSAIAIALLLSVGACGDDAPPPRPAAPSSHLLAADLLGAVPVLEAMTKEPGAEVVVVGRVRELAKGAFTIIDDSFEYCGRGDSSHDTCPTPWDYCCLDQEKVAAGTMVVKARTTDGKPIPKDALGVRPLDLVALRGKLEKNDRGDWAILSDAWFRRERPAVGPHIVWPD